MKKRMAETINRIITLVLTAVMLIAAGSSITKVQVRADEEVPEAVVEDRYQTDAENGDDTVKPQDSMSLMDTYTYDAAFEAHISAFPDTYKEALRRIHVLYPNFTFVADEIDMTLDEAVQAQIANGYKTYQSTYTDDYDTIYTFMNPLTYLYPEYDSRYDVYSSSFNYDWHIDADFFMFADHAYSTNQNADALYYLIEGCDFLEDESMEDIITASAKCQMNPYVMASTVILEKGWRAKANGNADVTGRVVNKGKVTDSVSVYAQENGTKGSSVLGTISNTDVYIVNGGDVTVDGKTWLKIVYDYDGDLFDSKVHGVPGFIESSKVSDIAYFNTYYNLFSINQSDNNPVVGGIAYAMSHEWTSLAASFEGGANFCKTFYYDNDQNTYYYMHYNVKNSTSNWWHEYSTGVSAGLKCARILRYAYDYDHSQSLVLHIPVYDPEPSLEYYNGVWTYINSKGEPDYSYNGVASNDYGTWYIKNGIVDFSINGIAEINGGYYYFKGGAVQTEYTGIVKKGSEYWYVENGRVTFETTEVIYGSAYGKKAWWYIKNSKVTLTNTIAPNAYGWWYINDGKVDFDCTSVEPNEYGWWYVKGGKVQFEYTGIKPNQYGWWRIVGGKVDFSCNTVEANEYGWWYCKGGKVQFNYTGLAPNKYGWWRIENGKVNFDFTGFAENEYGTWYLKGGKVQFDYTGLVYGNGMWQRVEGGKVITDYTGLAQNDYGWWYMVDGIVQFDYKGLAENSYGTWYLEDGKVQFDYTGTYTDLEGITYNIVNGKVQ